MPRNDRAIQRANRNIQNIAKGISGNMDALYRSTYMSTPQQSNDLKDLNDRINASIDSIVAGNQSSVGQPSVSHLYNRIAKATNKNNGQGRVVSELEKMFDNGLMTDDLYGVFMSNRFLRELDTEIDTVCKYMPKLQEALDVQKDCILSADHFSKDFLNLEYPGFSIDATIFSERVKDLKKKYKLPTLIEEIYEDTSKYGEKFIYRIPYKTAIGRLLATKPETPLIAPNTMRESTVKNETERFALMMNHSGFIIKSETDSSDVVRESATVMIESHKKIASGEEVTEMISKPILGKDESFKLAIEICKSGIIESAVLEHRAAFKNNKNNAVSMARFHEQQVQVLTEVNKKNPEAKGNIDWGSSKKDSRFITNDGLVTSGDSIEPVKVDIPGCVIRKLPRDQVLPIYIEDMCLGYYYLEIRTLDNSESFMGFKNILGDPLTNMRGDSRTPLNTVDTERQDDAIKYVAGQLSKFIDKQFVNNNQDLAKEIYMILKYNDLFNTPSIDLIKVTFIPPEDMVHFYFKQDDNTQPRCTPFLIWNQSVAKSLIPAKIYSSLYISDSIGHLTRGQDKRVYYVKQTVDTNIAQTLLNTISQIKQSNFGIRQFQNINNILNITGRFNDYVIPTNASGDPPIQFEVMPGQDIQPLTELMENLEEMAVNATGIPIEIIQARQSVDYAMQLTMSSSKVLRFCYKRQELYEDLLSDLISPIYNYEYNESVYIKVKLPPPSFINITNTNQLIDNTKGFVQSIVEVELANEQDDALRNKYTNELFKHYIGSHLDISAHEKIMNRCKIELAADKDESHSDGNDSDY